MARANLYFYLQPRYGCGSPAAVWDVKLALRIAAEERAFHDHALEGVYGEKREEKAKRLGVDGIVEARYEKGKGWMVKDVITGKTCYREDIPAKKLHPRDVVVRVAASGGGGESSVRFTVERLAKLDTKPSNIYVFVAGNKDPVCLWHSDTVTVERAVEAHEFKHAI